MMDASNRLALEAVAVVGPTASGKSAFALAIAERLATEIISADSMQVYRGMEIGTGAATGAERARVPHHFVSCLAPGEPFSAGEFQRQGREMLAAINNRGLPAVIAGGSGLYVSALLDGLFDGPDRDDAVRTRLEAEANEIGQAAMYARLMKVDPEYAAVVDENDLRRIVRGLEVYEIAGQPLSALHRDHAHVAEPVRARFVAIRYPRAELYERINQRVDAMLDAGFVDEIRALQAAGLEAEVRQLRALGYREFMAHFAGDVSYEEARAAMQQNTRRYAKRQLTWFRADNRIEWIEPGEQGSMDRSVGESDRTRLGKTMSTVCLARHLSVQGGHSSESVRLDLAFTDHDVYAVLDL
jgi:tRNA dimethylallyltransferase